MKVSYELELINFKAWSGGVNTLNKLVELDLVTEFESILDELYPEGLTETELNDILWFEPEWIFENIDFNITIHRFLLCL